MRVNIIHDDRLVGRYGLLMGELITNGITDYNIWSIVEDKDSVIRSINLSHKQIVAWAQKTKQKEVCIAEDDLMFTHKDGWQHFLNQKPKEFDLYLWGSYCVPLSNNKVTGFQLYVISEKFYSAFLSTPDNVHIDTEMDNLAGDYKYCYPFSALQRPCWSANNRAETNYNKNTLRPEDIWQGKTT